MKNLRESEEHRAETWPISRANLGLSNTWITLLFEAQHSLKNYTKIVGSWVVPEMVSNQLDEPMDYPI